MRGIFATGATKRTEIHTPVDIVLAHFLVMTVDYSDRVLSNQRGEGRRKKDKADNVFTSYLRALK